MSAYNIPVTNSTYTVNLGFAETNGDLPGVRVFDVNVGGQSLLNLDVAALVGQNAALIKTFSNVSVTAGSLGITFTPHTGSDCTEINGIEIVSGTSSDTTPPTTSITSPAIGATVSGVVSVQASASDNVGVAKVEFYLDGSLKATDTSSPYTWSWNTASSTNATHSFTTKAYDAAGNVGTSALVSVTVSNVSSGSGIPATLFGTHHQHIGDPFPLSPLGPAIGAIGKGSLVSWGSVQGVTASACPNHVLGNDDCPYDWTSNDAYVSLANSHGLDIFYSNDGIPPWASPGCTPIYNGCLGAPANIQDWKNFVTALVTRYDGQHGHGRMGIYECWNEPDQSSEYTGTTAQMVALCNAMHDIIRAHDIAIGANPPTLFLAPSTIPVSTDPPYNVSLDALLTAGMTTDFDVATWHYYDTVAARCCTGPGYMLPDLKIALANHGLSSKPIWDTEGSYNVNNGCPSDACSAYIAQTYLYYWSQGTLRFYWFSWDNDTLGQLGTDATGVNNASGIAYAQVRNWMVGSTMNSPCALVSGSSVVWTCGLKNSAGQQTQAVWNTSGSSTYTVPTGYGHYKDLAGNTTAISGGTVTIGIQPILLVP